MGKESWEGLRKGEKEMGREGCEGLRANEKGRKWELRGMGSWVIEELGGKWECR